MRLDVGDAAVGEGLGEDEGGMRVEPIVGELSGCEGGVTFQEGEVVGVGHCGGERGRVLSGGVRDWEMGGVGERCWWVLRVEAGKGRKGWEIDRERESRKLMS